MKCRKLRKELLSYVEGALDPAQAQQVRGHLAECPDCLGTYHDLKATLEMAALCPGPALSDTSAARMLNRIRERVSHRPRPRTPLARVPLATAAVLLLWIAIGWESGDRVPRRTDPEGLAYRSSSTASAFPGPATEDPDLYQAILERISSLEVQGKVQGATEETAAGREAGAGIPTDAGNRSSESSLHPVIPSVHLEILLKDLSDEEVEKVLQGIKERLTI